MIPRINDFSKSMELLKRVVSEDKVGSTLTVAVAYAHTRYAFINTT